MDTFVALDVEISSRSPIRVCAIGAVRVESGVEARSYRSLVQAPRPIHYSDIHGLRAADLVRAPPWPLAWAGVRGLLAGNPLIVAFRATFDRGAILTMCGRYAVRLPPLRFVCAAEIAASRCGKSMSLAETMAALGLPFPGRPHDPLADARAAAAIATACAPWPPAAWLG